jgi:pyridoxal phosphate enzyme (YggS family)
MSSVAERWQRIRDAAGEAAVRSGREPGAVTIVAASKSQPVAVLEEALAAGVTDLGENYVQEAEAKIAAIGGRARWHMIGHLQRNKAKRAVELFDVVHTLDNLALGQALDRQAAARGSVLPVLIEVNVGGEATKNGVAPEQAMALLAGLGTCAALRVEGLMTMPPPGPSAEAARPYFRQTRELLERLRAAAPANAPLQALSMGMSDDFTVAIEEGATLVRIGRALLGDRRTRG